MFFDQFDEIYCINLDSRGDRWWDVQHEFDKVGISKRVKRFKAIVGDGINSFQKAENGCRLSHCEIIKQAKERGLKNVLIFEDDVVFVSQPPEVLIPSDYALFYLGFYFVRGSFRKVDDNFLLLGKGCYALHAYAVNSTYYDVFLEGSNQVYPIDIHCVRTIHPKYRCYSLHPPIAFQSGSVSNLRITKAKWLNIMISNYNRYAPMVGAKMI